MNLRNFLLFLVGCLTLVFNVQPWAEMDDKQEKTKRDQKVENLINENYLENAQTTTELVFLDFDEKENYTASSANTKLNDDESKMSLMTVVANCKDASIFLDGDGLAVLDTMDINDASSCNCPELSFSLDISEFDCSDLGDNTVVLTVDDLMGNQATCIATVTVVDNVPPFFTCSSETYFVDIDGLVEIDPMGMVSNEGENCSVTYAVSQDVFSCSDLGANGIMITAEDPSGNTFDCSTSILVKDTIAPSALCNSLVSVSLDANGQYTLDYTEVDNGSSDNCGLSASSFSLSQYNFDCDDLGTSTHTMFVIDNSIPSNSANCSFSVEISNGSVPQMLCQDLAVELDDDGLATLLPEDINAGSSIACGAIDFALSVSSFDCSQLGSNTVDLIGIGDGGGTSTCSATITVEDNQAPVLSCLNEIIVALDANGIGVADPMDLVDDLEDNCSSALSLTLDQSTFDCTDIGSNNAVVIIASDEQGNSSTCNSSIQIVDDLGPVLNCFNSTVTLSSGSSEEVSTDEFISSLTDNCDDNPTLTPSTYSFDCSLQGENTVILTATDQYNNSTTCNVTVTVGYDDTPVASCLGEITVELNANGEGSISELDVDAGSYVLCENPSLELDQEMFTCADLGSNTVELTVTNDSGNTAECITTVFVEDNENPSVVCNNEIIIIELDVNGEATGSYDEFVLSTSDNCSLVEFDNAIYSFNCGDIGFNLVTVTVFDESDNDDSCNAFIEVVDNLSPNAVCNDVEVVLGFSGTVTVDASTLSTASTDNCSLQNSNATYTFDCEDVGTPVSIEVEVFDASNNLDVCTSLVTVLDALAPVASCQSTEIFVNADNIALLNAESINNNSFDNCSNLIYTVSQSEFNCDDLGLVMVELTVTDQSGNSDNCSTMITISDNSNPQAECAPLTEVVLDANGNLELQLIDIFSGSSFSCSGFDSEIDPSTFDCTDVGQFQNVELTIFSNNGQNSVANCLIQILDQTAPTFECVDLVTTLDETTEIIITPEDLVENVSDECTADEIYYNFETLTLNCDSIGTFEKELIVVDGNLNPDTCTVSITLIDNTQPIAICNDMIDVFLDEDGSASIEIDDINNGSSNLCGEILPSAGTVLSQNTFYCDNVGANIITLLVTDALGNEDECQSIVNVFDAIDPEIVSYEETITLTIAEDQDFGQVTSGVFNAIGTDNCGISVAQIRRIDDACESDTEFGASVKFCAEECNDVYELELRLLDVNANFQVVTVYVNLINNNMPEPCDVSASGSISILSDVVCSPNPFMEETHLNFYLNEQSDTRILVYAADGSVVSEQHYMLNSGTHNIPVNLGYYPPGAYFCQLITPKGSQTLRLIKMN